VGGTEKFQGEGFGSFPLGKGGARKMYGGISEKCCMAISVVCLYGKTNLKKRKGRKPKLREA